MPGKSKRNIKIITLKEGQNDTTDATDGQN